MNISSEKEMSNPTKLSYKFLYFHPFTIFGLKYRYFSKNSSAPQ